MVQAMAGGILLTKLMLFLNHIMLFFQHLMGTAKTAKHHIFLQNIVQNKLFNILKRNPAKDSIYYMDFLLVDK